MNTQNLTRRKFLTEGCMVLSGAAAGLCTRSLWGGGYVFNNVHNIQVDMPPESILAIFDTAYQFGFYD